MLQVEPTNWDDVPEPTDAELAEIDAAIEAAPKTPDVQFVDAWAASYPVRMAVEAVGYPDGTTAWQLRFTAHLLALTDAVAPYQGDALRMLELASRWHNAVGHIGWTRGGQLPTSLLKEMVEIIPLPAVARYLDATEDQVLRWLFPKADIDAYKAAVEAVKNGMTHDKAAREFHIGRHKLELYLKAYRIQPVRVKADGRRLMPPWIRERILEIGLECGPLEAQRRINEEIPEAQVSYIAVKSLLRRRDRRAA